MKDQDKDSIKSEEDKNTMKDLSQHKDALEEEIENEFKADGLDALEKFIFFCLFAAVFVLFSYGAEASSKLFFKEPSKVPVEVLRVYDGDSITVNIPSFSELLGDSIGIRLRGVDTPEIRGKCLEEKVLALEARDFVRGLLSSATHVEINNISRGKYFRLVADVYFHSETFVWDGNKIKLSDILLENGFAVPYDGGTKYDWCEGILTINESNKRSEVTNE